MVKETGMSLNQDKTLFKKVLQEEGSFDILFNAQRLERLQPSKSN